ncbi:cytochrome P450 [Phanerochaete sordida]|uniref:Cytochrome P450 n=1 Tax=Phanerochaete sordida TaxID=48140 RepID=A0A9P3GN70_9APHY|nr:cytochrome P450 [Phanerochaete sordida]
MFLEQVTFPPIPWLAFGLIFVCALFTSLAKRPRYPPGPKGLPVVGNLFDVPVDNPWIRYTQLGQQLGSDIIHFEVLGRHIVVLNSVKAARDLLEKRSSNYSGRAESVMFTDITGWHRNWALWPYDDGYKAHKKAFAQHFRPEALPKYHATQVKGVHTLLKSILDSPDAFHAHVECLTGQVLLEIVYGFQVARGEPLLALVGQAVFTLKQIADANVYLADVIPIFKYLLSWFPGAGFKWQAAIWKKLVDGMYEEPYRRYKAALSEGAYMQCLTTALMSLTEDSEAPESADMLTMSIAGTTYGAGAGTTMDSIQSFILAATMFPETQLAAQREIDNVLGRQRLPTIEDEAALPHVTTMMYELLRWSCVGPIALPHKSEADDEYDGYFIPGGTVMIANVWSMLHDASAFPDPECFDPTRFLAEDGTLNSDMSFVSEAFGFGRRICPGRHFARDFIWLAIANILAVFTVAPALDDQGGELKLTAEFTTRSMRCPLPFKCRFIPRFPEADSLIRSAAANN